MTTLRTEVPPDVFAAMRTEATAEGVTVGAHTRRVVLDHVSGKAPAHVRAMAFLVRERLALPVGIEVTKNNVMRFARENGWTG